ncbi:MAG: argininosuccinate lyase [Spirochaetaceae bacterium]|nr:MAG: argininosuccinate lyase [Spirochaetaceae bacterium]
MATLWHKGHPVNEIVQRFTVGRDHLLDRRLVRCDCAGSLAHAKMLAAIGVLSGAELEQLAAGLARIVQIDLEDGFPISEQDEDCHTAIENWLTERYPQAGMKIHTGRSRNDQVLTALRLYTRAKIAQVSLRACEAAGALVDLASKHTQTAMPGRTHLQTAMLSSVALWAAAFAEALVDDLQLLLNAYDLADQCPLGAAASYGVPLPLDREYTAELLGFSRVQNNVLYVNNSRGKIEAVALDAAEAAVSTVAKLACDLMLFSLPEFGYFELPAEMCTGSSIMPQKKNPDVLELTRARAGILAGLSAQLKNVIRNLPSGYNRDFQETKQPLLQGLDVAEGCLEIMALTVGSVQVNREALLAACTPELFAADEAFALVQTGMPFREAYRTVASRLDAVAGVDPVAALALRTSAGSPGNLGLSQVAARIDAVRSELGERTRRAEAAVERLFGRPVALL